MAVFGCLGDVTFQASSDTVETLRDFQWSGAANYAVHKRHSGRSLTEFLGAAPDKISFKVELSRWMGVAPHQEINKIWRYERTGEPVALTVGDKAYGYYRWNIISHQTKVHETDGRGNIMRCTVTLNLQEYLKG